MAGYEWGAADAGGGGGIGGKFRKRPFRRSMATPYDRPATALLPRTTAEAQGSGWFSKLVHPASRIIRWSASRLLPSSVFQKRLGAALPEANRKSMEGVPREPYSSGGTMNHMYLDLEKEEGSSPTKENSLLKVQEQVVNSSDGISGQQDGASCGVDEVSEIEQKFKQKTFTRAEFDRLTEFLHSRTVESIKPEVALNCEHMDIINVQGQTNKQQCASEVNVSQPASGYHIEMAVSGQGNMHQSVDCLSQPLVDDEKSKPVALGQESGSTLRLHLNYATPPVGLTGPEDEPLSPMEVAKEYMRPRHLKASPAALSMQDKLFLKDRPLLVRTPYMKKSSDSSMALGSAIGISRSVEDRPTSYMTPKLHGRSALYKMARSPCFQPRFRANPREDRSLLDGHAGPSTSTQLISSNVAHSSSKKMLKRGSSVLDDGIGSSSFTRRTRQKSNLTSHFDQGFITSNQKLLYHRNDKEIEAAQHEGPAAPVPPRSTEMARKILEQLDKMVTPAKERTFKSKIDMDESSHLLTPSMLHERAMKSMEEIDTSRFLDAQRHGSFDASSDFLHHRSLGNTIPLKQDKAEENGLTKSVVKEVQVTSKDSALEKHNKISSTGTDPSVVTADFSVTDAATTSIYKKPSFQMSAPEDLAELDDDSDDINDSCSRATVVDNKPELLSMSEVIPGDRTNMRKPVESSSDGIQVAAEVSDTKFKKVSNSICTEKTNGISFSVAPSLTNSSQLPSISPTSPTSLEKSVLQKAGLEPSYASGFPSIADTKLGVSNATTADVSERSKDKVVKTLKEGELSNAFGNSTNSGLPVFGESRSASLNDDIASITSTSSLPAVPVAVTDATFRSGFSTGIGDTPSSTTIASSAAPVFSTISFQFGASASPSAPTAVSSSTIQNGSGNLVAESIKSSVFSVNSPAKLDTSNILSNTSSTLLVPASISGSSSPPTASALFNTATVSAISSSAAATSSNGLFKFGSSTESGSTSSLFSSNGSHSSTIFGTAGSTFSTQPTQSGIVNAVSSLSSNATTNSSSSFSSSAPMTMFGLGTSSPGSASSLFGFSAPASSSGFSFPAITGSTSNISISNTLTTPISFGSSSVFSFSGSGSSSSHASAAAFGSSSFSFSTSATLPTSSTGNVSFGAGTGSALFGSTPQTQLSAVSGSIFGSTASSPSTGFSFGSASGSGSAPFTFGASSGAGFSFTSVGSTTTSSTSLNVQPMFGAPNQIAGPNSGSPGNDQMNVEDSMADDSVQASIQPVSAFGQPSITPAPPNFMFNAPTAPAGISPFQFGGQQNNFTPQVPPPFQPAGSLDFAGGGGSFSLGSGGDKSGRKIVKVRRDKHRKK